MKIKIIDVTRDNFGSIPRPANQSYNCQKCFYWVEKMDGRKNLAKQKKKWLARREMKHGGSLAKILLWGQRENPVGFAQFGPISEYSTANFLYQNGETPPKKGWCIACVAVQSPYRGKGLATRLIRHVLKDLKNRGVKTVDAYPLRKVNSWNQVSVGPLSLWEKCGFQEVTRIRYTKGLPMPKNGEEFILVRKRW